MNKIIKVPTLGESINEATVSGINFALGDYVKIDDIIAELETDKVNMEVYSPYNGVLKEIKHKVGDNVEIDEELFAIDDSIKPQQKEKQNTEKKESRKIISKESNDKTEKNDTKSQSFDLSKIELTPSQKKNYFDELIKNDKMPTNEEEALQKIGQIKFDTKNSVDNGEFAIKMSPFRKTIAKKLKESQNNTVSLTTFNEIDMSNVIQIRNKYKEDFLKIHDVKLGFMSFFTKAVNMSLGQYPVIAARIDNDNIVYNKEFNIGIAVSSDKGLIVPVVKKTNNMSLAEIEKEISKYANKARKGNISIEDLQNGHFTISNGGVFGSMMSTPIINPPQSAILGLHNITKRPVVIEDEIAIRSMMYVALSYDHRIIDGKEAVGFLRQVKFFIENPERILLEF